MRFLVDTNVFLDYLLGREPYSEEAESFFRLSRVGRHQIYICSMSLRDIGYMAHKYYHDKEIANIIQLKTYCICTKVVDLSASSAIEGIYEDNTDYEDFLISNTANENSCDIIVTNNVKDFKNSRIPALSLSDVNKALLYVNKSLDF